ncbi:FeoB-associated Cys-rich membrane protein [Faecalibacterium prausnitzii]|uniref:FeoB-associated Cys-rich membrane protein n=1 Tax=Faecalibacterium wellingii TaxID=2929491 RepID=A0AB35Y5E3_9FIRM|nr:FeoB-associated Cys-rich membrane protein [Faecalibacterium sp.]
MLTLRGIITLIVLVILFALAVVWISKQGGWKGEGCGGNCASCHSRCENPDPSKKH